MEEKELINDTIEDKTLNEPENGLADGEEHEAGGLELQPPQLQPIEMPQGSLEQVKIGDIFLGSCRLDAGQLVSLALGILKEDFVKDYLEKLKERRTGSGAGSMFG